MELKQIKDLMSSMGQSGIRKLRIKHEDFEIELEREGPKEERGMSLGERHPEAFAMHPRYTEEQVLKSKVQDIPTSVHPLGDQKAESPTKDNGLYVQSPMVGTFYSAPGPDEPIFVKVGDKISKDTVVCIVEAMKVMNEVKAGVEGTVTEVLVENGHPVEFGTKLFKVTA